MHIEKDAKVEQAYSLLRGLSDTIKTSQIKTTVLRASLIVEQLIYKEVEILSIAPLDKNNSNIIKLKGHYGKAFLELNLHANRINDSAIIYLEDHVPLFSDSFIDDYENLFVEMVVIDAFSKEHKVEYFLNSPVVKAYLKSIPVCLVTESTNLEVNEIHAKRGLYLLYKEFLTK